MAESCSRVCAEARRHPSHFVGRIVGLNMPKSHGRHQTNRLVPAMVGKYAPGFHSDGNCLYLKVEPNGSRRWILRTTLNKRRRDFGLGAPPTVSLRDAREEALKLLKDVRAGVDPAETRRKQAGLISFETEARAWYDSVQDTFRNEVHRRQIITTLESYVFPHIGSRAISEIGTSDIHALILPIWNTKKETADRVLQRVGKVFDWAETRGHFTGKNPVQAVRKGLPKRGGVVKSHAALPYRQVPKFICALRSGKATDTVKWALEFLILTAARSGEVRGATWSEFNKDYSTWTIPATRMKAGREHVVPLSNRATEIIKAASKTQRGELVFTIDGKHPLSDNTLLKVVRSIAGDYTAHGFRSSFRDWAAESTEYAAEICEAALAHQEKNKVVRAYLRTQNLEKRRGLLSDWGKFCNSIPDSK